jgi:3-oxoacyl-[acyl-carrier protein] reductase
MWYSRAVPARRRERARDPGAALRGESWGVGRMDLGLRDRAVVITGASRGIGRAAASLFAAEGARLLLVARGEAAVREAAAGAARLGSPDARPLALDVAAAGAAERIIAEARDAFGRLDVLVNNVGGSRGDPGVDASDAEWGEVLDINLLAAVRLCRAAVPMLRESRGAIVNVTSIFGREWGGAVSYNAAKAALIAYTKSLSRLLAPEGVRVNSVAPGSTLHPGGSWDRKRQADPEGIARFVERELPYGRFGAPEETAAVIVFLASARAGLVTGACVNVDGGQSRSLI